MHFEHDTETSSMIHQRVSERAYEIWMERGCPEGTAEEDWYMAEREIEGSGEPAETPEAPFIYTAAV
jgi:hypothetical protein